MPESKMLKGGEYVSLNKGAIPIHEHTSTSEILSVCVGEFSQNTNDFNLSQFGALLGNAHRLDILEALKPCPKPVVGFAKQVGLTPAHCRHHLAVLVKHGIVASKIMRVVGVTRDKDQMVFGLTVLGEKVLNAYGGKA